MGVSGIDIRTASIHIIQKPINKNGKKNFKTILKEMKSCLMSSNHLAGKQSLYGSV